MVIELLIFMYIVLFGLGFATDLKLSSQSKDKYYWLSIPLTAPIIGAKLVLEKLRGLRK